MDDRRETLESETQSSDEIEMEKLEEEMKQMAEKIVGYREKLPDQFRNTIASILAARRPAIVRELDNGSQPGPSGGPDSGTRALDAGGSSSMDNETEHAEKVKKIKEKFASHVAAMPVLLKRMKDSMSRINKLELGDEDIHPAFKRKQTGLPSSP